jgi:hypothetical protein
MTRDWTKREDAILVEGLSAGIGIADIAKQVGRTSSACHSRARRLGVTQGQREQEAEHRMSQRANERRVADQLADIVRLIDRGISPQGVRLRVTRAITQLEGGAQP